MHKFSEIYLSISYYIETDDNILFCSYESTVRGDKVLIKHLKILASITIEKHNVITSFVSYKFCAGNCLCLSVSHISSIVSL